MKKRTQNRFRTRIVSLLMTLGLLVNDVGTPLMVYAQEDEEEVVIDEEDDQTDPVEESVTEEALNASVDMAPTGWGSAISERTDSDDHVIYRVYNGATSSEKRLLICADPSYNRQNNGSNEYYGNENLGSGHIKCDNSWQFVSNNEEIGQYKNQITEVVIRGIGVWEGTLPFDNIKKLYFDDYKGNGSYEGTFLIVGGMLAYKNSLQEVMLPKGLISIPDRFAEDCKNLTRVFYCDGTNKPYSNIDYDWDANDYTRYGQQKIALREIEEGAFKGCTKLSTFPRISPTYCVPGNYLMEMTIGYNAFNGCSALNMEFDFTKTKYLKIGVDAFAHSGITRMILPDSTYPNYEDKDPTTGNDIPWPAMSEYPKHHDLIITSGICEGCSNLVSFNFGDKWQHNGQTYNNSTYSYDGDAQTDVPSYMFTDCTSLAYLYYQDSGERKTGLPSCVNKIGAHAFENCTSLPGQLFNDISWGRDFGRDAFKGCTFPGGTDVSYTFVTGVSLSPKTVTLNIGQTQNLTKTIAPGNASNENVSYKSNNTSIATVDQNGKITAVAPGSTSIVVTTKDGEYTDTCNVTVNTPVSGVTLSPKTVSVYEGATTTLTATVAPSNASNKAVTYSSDKTNIATVTNGGVVTGVKAGTATITVTTTDGSKTDTCTVTVNPVAVTGVSVSPTSVSIEQGSTQKITATVSPENASNKAVTFTSSDTTIATVASDGTITGVKKGNTVVVVSTIDGGKIATCNVTVTKTVIPVSSVSISPTTLALNVGGSSKVTATVSPSNADNKNVSFTSSNPSIAAVAADGTVIAISGGTATITAITEDGSKTATCTVTVTAPTVAVTGVSVAPTSLGLVVGASSKLTATVSPSDATNKAVNYSSNNTSVATVTSDGTVTAVAAGSAVITVTTEDGAKTATCNVTVNTPAVNVTGIAVTPKTLTLTVGGTGSVTASVSPENASNKAVTFESNREDIATVDEEGNVTAYAVGSATITATSVDGSFTDTCVVTVNAANNSKAVTGVTANPKTMSLLIDESKTLLAVITPEDATNKAVSFESSNTSVATVNAVGKVTGVTPGTATITITTADGNFTDTCTVTVEDEIFVHTTGVSFNKKELTLSLNGYDTLVATIAPANATNKAITYSSSDPKIAYIDNSGTVTGKGYGVATITVTTADRCFTDTCTVTVTDDEVPVSGVTVSPKTLTLKAGKTGKLTAAVAPTTATNKDVIWESADPKIATVASDGTVKGVVSGNVIITATTEDGGFTDTCNVTVEKADAEPENPTENPTEDTTEEEEDDAAVKGTYKVSFYNGTVLLSSSRVAKGAVVANVPTVTKNGYDFIGWYDKDAMDYWAPASPVYSNITVYARFIDKTSGEVEPMEGDDIAESYDNIENAVAARDIYLIKGQKVRLNNCSVTSADNNIVSVATGVNVATLNAKGIGVTTISVTNAQNITLTHTVHVNLPELPLKSIKMQAGQEIEYAVEVGNDTGKYKVNYSSTSPDVAYAYNGTIYAISKGSATIYTHVNGKKYACKVTVKDPSSSIIATGQMELVPLQTATLKFTDGFKAKKAAWTVTSISGNNVVTIKKNKITATGIGVVHVKGIDNNGRVKEFTVTVNAAEPQVVHINAGKSKNLKFYKLSNKKAAWNVSGNAVTVSKGKIKAMSAGTATVTATYQGFTFTAYVVVDNPQLPVDGKIMQNGKKYVLPLKIGENYALKLTGTDQAYIFTADKPEIARVDANGLVKAGSMGKAKLTTKINGRTITVNVIVQ
ncbi:MAG: Ig-like domain-containing protein [Lachnospiraceae bacterium]|nr:Ig-like domain-containing protein [Lachnospiraceae bacterium]